MPHVDDLLGFASLASAGLVAAVVVSSATGRDLPAPVERANDVAIVRIEPVEVVGRAPVELARMEPRDGRWVRLAREVLRI
jgi:hypothetical protein